MTAGIILAVTLVTLNWIAGWATFRSKRMEVIIEGRPIVLVHDGHVEMEGLRKAQMTMHELNASLRAEGHSTTDDVLVAMLENNGRVTVVPRRKSEKP